MSKKRSIEEIQKDYNGACGLLGHLIHQTSIHENEINKKQREIDKISLKLSQLSQEADRLKLPEQISEIQLPIEEVKQDEAV